MTEHEAMSVLKMVETHGALTTNAKDMAIKALEYMAKLKEMGECYIIPKSSHWEINGIDVHMALEKQIAKKPYRVSEIDDNDNAMVECPICHANSDYSVNTIKSGYCWKCGQKLDWEWGNENGL